MKRNLMFALLALLVVAGAQAQKDSKHHGYPISPVPFTSVKVSQGFWGQRLNASREVTIPLAFHQCEINGRYTNFERAAHPSDNNKVSGYSFDDTDVYKTIEGASYSLQTFPNPKLQKYIDSVLVIVAAAQEPDGYLYTARTQNPKNPHEWAGMKRWEKEEDLSHELYDLGHMIDGAVAHYQATGKRNFLDIAIKYADCVCREVGDGQGQSAVVPGHQIAEMALARLYLATGDKKYLDEAKYFLDKRGRTDHRDEYSQSHLPVTEQSEAVGHAVRATYMYSGMADIAALTGDTSYVNAIDRIWNDIVGKKYYITGGIGATGGNEGFGPAYDLPNMTAYCETCASIGLVYVNYRLFLLHGESKYYDVLERTLYNALIDGVSLDGGKFFYPNPLASNGQHQRQEWFGCACCPSNICRFIPSIPGYVYQVKDNNLYVNLFMGNTGNLLVNGKKVTLTQTTNYPWEGEIAISIDKNAAGKFALKVRIPGWAKNQAVPSDLYAYNDGKHMGYTVKVNGADAEGELTQDGYFTIDRKWKKGDKVQVHFDMEPRTVKANAKVTADVGMVAIERGPLVYCAEWPDNSYEISSLLLPRDPKFTLVSKPDLLNGITELVAPAQTLKYDENGKLITTDVTLTLIPYYSWAHRGNGKMSVWLPISLKAARPATVPTIASGSKITASARENRNLLRSIADGEVPANAEDRSIQYYHWWPKHGGTEWVSYEFENPTTISTSTVYWYDDGPWQDCRVPQSWKLYYKDEQNSWKEVETNDKYTTEKGVANQVNFKPVKTGAVKLEVNLPEEHSSGIYEWSVK